MHRPLFPIRTCLQRHVKPFCTISDLGYGRGGTPIFTVVFEPLARVAVYVTDEIGLGTCFGAA